MSDIPLPWTRARDAYALLGLVKKCLTRAVNTAYANALAHEASDVD